MSNPNGTDNKQHDGALMVVSRQLEAQTQAMLDHNRTLLEICKLELADRQAGRTEMYKALESFAGVIGLLVQGFLDDKKARRESK